MDLQLAASIPDTHPSRVPLGAVQNRSSEEAATNLSVITRKKWSRRQKWQQPLRLESCLSASFPQWCPGHITLLLQWLCSLNHISSQERGGPATSMTELQGPSPFGFLLPGSMNLCHGCPVTPAQQEMWWEEGVQLLSLSTRQVRGLFSGEMCIWSFSHWGRTHIWGSLLSVRLHLLFSHYRKIGWWLCHLWLYLIRHGSEPITILIYSDGSNRAIPPLKKALTGGQEVT